MGDQVKSSVIRGRSFCFSITFPDVQRGEIVGWIREGGGKLVDTWIEKNVNYIVEAHGVHCTRTQFNGVTNVSTHWIWCCLQDGRLLDVISHILFFPLQCQVPLPGFTGLRFCESHYEEKGSRDLLRNLCYVLGGRLVKTLTKKVNYLICKFTEGQRYEAARALGGIHTVTMDWILESIKQNKIVDSTQFFPKEAIASDRETGICTMSQYPSQTIQMVFASQVASHSHDGQNQLHDGSNSLDSVCRIVFAVNKVFTSDLPAEDPHFAFGLSKHWTSRRQLSLFIGYFLVQD